MRIILTYRLQETFMNFGFVKFFLLFLILAAGALFAFLALVDVPVAQQEIVVTLPAQQ
jgi:hypothetical protein